MLTIDAVLGSLKGLTRDGWLLFFTRSIRLFAYGLLSVVLVFYLIALGLSESQAGILLTLTLLGDVVVSLYLTTRADRIGRRRMLIVGAILMAAAGLAFACTKNLLLLIIAGTIGVISQAVTKWARFSRLSRPRFLTSFPSGRGRRYLRGTR